jgi:hypothetical protein
MANQLWVGSDQTFHTIADAVAASGSGDTIYVKAGTYVNDWSAIDHNLNIIGVGGYAHLVSTGDIDNGKAMLVTNANVTVQNLEFSGASVGDQNGAGIRHESGDLTVLNSYFHDNQEGILAGDNAGVHITIRDSEFAHNGAGDGQSHGVYVGQIASLLVGGSDFHDTVLGNQLKSRAAETTVENSHFATGPYAANYDIDLPNGGVANIHDNTFDKGATSDNRAIIHFGGEIDNPVGSLVVSHNSFVSNLVHTSAVLNQTDLSVQVSDNVVSGVEYILYGSGTQTNNGGGAVTGSAPDIGPAPVDVTGGNASPPPTNVGGNDTPPPATSGDTPPANASGDTPPVDVSGDTPPVNASGDTPPPDGGTDVAGDPAPAPEPAPAPAPEPAAPQWAAGWHGGGTWDGSNGDGVGFTGVGHHHQWHDWTT